MQQNLWTFKNKDKLATDGISWNTNGCAHIVLVWINANKHQEVLPRPLAFGCVCCNSLLGKIAFSFASTMSQITSGTFLFFIFILTSIFLWTDREDLALTTT